MLTLFTFECVNVDNCHNMIIDESKSSAYINNGLRPMLDHIVNGGFSHTILAIELFNEPEWMIVGGVRVERLVDLESV